MPTMLSAEELIAKHIQRDPRWPEPDEARLAAYGVSVWVLVAYFQASGFDIDRVARDYAVPREAVEAALAYYQQHKHLIDARIEVAGASFVA